MQTSNSSEYKEFSKELLPLVSDGRVRNTISEVVMSGGAGDGKLKEIKLGELGEPCIVNDFSFKPDGNIRNVMQACQELVDCYSTVGVIALPYTNFADR